MLLLSEEINMLGMWLLRRHANKSKENLNGLNRLLSKNDFAIMLASYDGYEEKLPRWVWWFY